MASRIPGRQVLIPLGILMTLILVGNFWISGELSKLEEISAVASSSPEPSAVVAEPPSVYGIVKIDPDNDPLAPVVHLGQPQKAPTDQPADVPKPVYEVPSDSPVLAQ